MARILIVDDEPQIRRLLQRYLSGAGYACRAEENVAAAKRALQTHTFDLILSDVTMPGESGIDLIRYVGRNYPDTPMVMASVIDNPGEVREALELGVYGYIVKPFTGNIVLINVENALRRKKLERDQAAHLEQLETIVRQRTQTINDQLTLLQTLIDAIPSPLFYKNKDGVFQGCNRAFEVLAGEKRATIIGKPASEVVPKLLADISRATDRQLIDNPGKVAYEYDVIYPDGSGHNFLLNKATFLDAGGNVAGLVGVMVDITEHKAAEEALRLSEEKFRRIVENIGIGVALISADAHVLELNRQMRKWFPDILPGTRTPCYQLFNNGSRDKPCQDCPTMEAMATGRVCESVVGSPGIAGKRSFRIIASPIHGRDGKVTAAIELVEDVTEKMTMERELRQAQKLEAIGQLAAGIAHEINTPIQYVGDNIRFLEDAFRDLNTVMAAHADLLAAAKGKSESRDLIQKVETTLAKADTPYLAEEIPNAIQQSLEGVQRVSKIIRAMRQFSHPGGDRKEAVDLNQALESTITVARNEWKYVADLETDFAPDLPLVPCFPGEMNQVFLNLIINAAHAISDATEGGRQGKGNITVSTRPHEGAVTIRIHDTGKGIPEAIQNRIFDPFFTTKAVGKGTGQGLAISRSVVVDKHGGRLGFDTEKDKGTTFVIELPLNSPSEKEASSDV
jgi:PAS domain S-box-containing protein